MVEKMIKYSFILLDEETEGFLRHLQELGVVDITRSRKPVDERSASMLEKASAERRAISTLKKTDYRDDPDHDAIVEAARGAECGKDLSASTARASSRIAELQTALANAARTAKSRIPWGGFDREALNGLEKIGLKVRFYTVSRKGFDESWKELYPQSKLGKLQVVFDNPNSGLIHYAIDSICEGQKLASTLTALKSNEEVIDYVSKTPGAMGVIGANWIGNVSDSTRLSFNESVRVMAVSNSGHATVANSFKPYQAYLALRQYPLTHDVFILVNDPRNGLPTGLMTFLTKDRGQRIILKSGLVPATQPVRLVNVKDEF